MLRQDGVECGSRALLQAPAKGWIWSRPDFHAHQAGLRCHAFPRQTVSVANGVFKPLGRPPWGRWLRDGTTRYLGCSLP